MAKNARRSTAPRQWAPPPIPSAPVALSMPSELVGPILVLSVHARPRDLGIARRAYLADRKAGKPVWTLVLSSKTERIERRIVQPRSPEQLPREGRIHLDAEILEGIRQLQSGQTARVTGAGPWEPDVPLNVSQAAKLFGVDRQEIRRALKRKK